MGELLAVDVTGYALMITIAVVGGIVAVALTIEAVRVPILRWWCRKFGHAPVKETRAAPVIELFFICRRCGKYAHTMEELTALDRARRAGVRIGSER